MTVLDQSAVLSLRARAALRDGWLSARLERIVPILMNRSGVDAWVLIAREYNEDPVVSTMLPAEWMTARRRTVLVFLDAGRRRLAVSRYPVGEFFEAAWDPTDDGDQWSRLAAILDEADPAAIAVNRSRPFALADGLSASQQEELLDVLPGRLRERVVDGAALAVGWLETRTSEEIEHYSEVCRLAHRILREGLSNSVIAPGRTTTEDLEWWYRERVSELGLRAWFHPTASIQRRGAAARTSFADNPESEVIYAGDLVHVDFGIEYLGLHTDMQEMLYVGLPGEGAPPVGLEEGFALGKRLQDIIMSEFATGRTGNEILAAARAVAAAEGLDPTIYTHPIGLHGHAAGPTIGMWDQQDGVPGAGDYPVYPDTAYSIECNVRVAVPEWEGQEVAFMLEEDAFFDGVRVEFIDGRQERLWFLRT